KRLKKLNPNRSIIKVGKLSSSPSSLSSSCCSISTIVLQFLLWRPLSSVTIIFVRRTIIFVVRTLRVSASNRRLPVVVPVFFVNEPYICRRGTLGLLFSHFEVKAA
ncbi:hypothetical protein V8G54_004335, partial [Vigna mungo]